MSSKVKIQRVSSYLPPHIVTNGELEELVNQQQYFLVPGMLERLFGIKERRFAAVGEQVSDMAAQAARPIVEELGAENIDYLIFAGACSDLIEPATANILQHKLGLSCPVFDLKNACNSFVDAITVGASLIQSGLCRNVLIANGEKLSDAIRLDGSAGRHHPKHLAAYSLGDAGAAMLLTPSDDESGLCFQQKMTEGRHWELCTIKGGGSMHPHDMGMTYFEGDTAGLKDVIAQGGTRFIQACYQASGWSAGEIDHLFTHQVSAGTFRMVEQASGVPPDRILSVFEQCGNTAAASIPLAIDQAQRAGTLRKGDKVMLFGIGAGFSLSIQFFIW